MTPGETTVLLERWALEAGFDRAGVATLEPTRQGGHLRRWLERGEHASMEWIARRTEIREDPSRLLPGARSALCVTLQYHPLTGEEEPAGDLWPRVARYARGQDYHDVMGRRLKALAATIHEAFPGCGTRPYVDTGPILERELAARAGLGSQGKNTMLLCRDQGSWFLLGEILLTLDLGTKSQAWVSRSESRSESVPRSRAAGSAFPDRLPAKEGLGRRAEPQARVSGAADLCGHCTRCLEACPTGALYEPYRLDSNRCISYWTIEHRGDLPLAAREMIGDWVFGCDVCQEVCPYNDRPRSGTPRPADHPELRLPPERSELDLAGLLELDRESYVERFRGSPMKRAKLDGLRRNAAVAMGHRGEPRYVPALARTLRTGGPMLRRHAAWALGRLGDPSAEAALERAAAVEEDPAVGAEISAARHNSY